MGDFLLTALAFVAALSVLIAVHEFGHFWVARRLGVKVLRFSIGFGKPLWLHRAGPDQTEYVIAAVPLGGYVKMLDEREGAVAPAELGRAFNRQPVGKRIAIVAAGPVFNLLFAMFAYWMMFVGGVPGMRPLLGEISPDSLAYAAGLREQQEIVAVAGRATPTWGAVFDTLLPYALKREPVDLMVDDGGVHYTYRLPLDSITAEDGLKPDAMTQAIGLHMYRPRVRPVIEQVGAGSAAEQAGLQTGDEILAIDAQAIATWEELVAAVQAHPQQPLPLTVRRGGAELVLVVTPTPHEGKQGTVGRIGASVHIEPGMVERLRAEWRLDPLAAVGAAWYKTWDMAGLTLRVLGEMIVGRASTENLSGPITIAIYAKSSAVAGWTQFAGFLAVISVSLAVLNLLPIPILDGGHLAFYLVELVQRRPVSERMEAMAQKVGLTIILLLMAVAMYNDLARLLGE